MIKEWSTGLRVVVGGVVLAGLGLVVWKTSALLGSIAAALIMAYILEPPVSALARRGVPRALGVLLIAVGLVAALGLLFGMIVPALVSQLQGLGSRLEIGRLEDPGAWPASVRGVLDAHQEEIEAARLWAIDWIRNNAARIATDLAAILGRAFSSAAAFVVAALNLIIVPLLAFYFLVDYPRMVAGAAGLVPPRLRPTTFRLGQEVDRVLRAFLRGQAMVALSLSFMYAIGLALTGTPLGVVIGLLAGLLSVVPYLGLVLGIVPSLLLNFLEHQSLGRVLAVVAVFVVAQTIEGFVLTPYLVGDAVGLNPIVVVVAVLVGGQLFGFAGILLAVPVAAAGSVFWREGLEYYRGSSFFRGPPNDPAA